MRNFNIIVALLLSFQSFAQCESVTFTLTSNPASGGPSLIDWEIENQVSGEIIGSDVYLFSSIQNTLVIEECLVQGCYRLRIESDDFLSAQTLSIVITDSQGNSIEAFEPIDWQGDRVDYVFGIMGGCSGVGDCMSAFEWMETSTPGEIAMTNFSMSDTPASYTWSYGNGQTSFDFNPTLQFDANGIYEVCLLLSAECIVTSCQQVAVTGFPVDCPESLVTTEESCGNWIFLSGANSNETVQWTIGNNPAITSASFLNYHFSTPGEFNVCANFNSVECGAIELCATVTIVDCSDNSGCPGELEFDEISCGEFEFEVVNGELGSVEWTFGDGATISDAFNVTHAYTTPGDYIACAFYTSDFCQSGIELCVPIHVIDCTGTDCNIAVSATTSDGQTFAFVATTTIDATELLWDFGDGSTDSGVSNTSHAYTTNGFHLACVSIAASNDCPQGSSTCTTVVVTAGSTSIEEIEEATLIYPNPVSSQLFIRSEYQITGFNVRDHSGRIVATNEFNHGFVDISNLESGYYILELITEKGRTVKTFSVAK